MLSKSSLLMVLKPIAIESRPAASGARHHYHITVFAVDVAKLPDAKNDSASAALVGFDLHFHTLAKVTLTGMYGR